MTPGRARTNPRRWTERPAAADGQCARRETGEPAAPLAGVRILAVEQYGAGPYATLYLADMGAEVIKIEDPRNAGDVGRYVPPGHEGTDSLFFETFNRGKRSLLLDLLQPAGQEVLRRLASGADAVLNNLRGNLPDRLGLTYATLGAVNPAIVCVSLSAFGRTGARCARPGYDALVQAEAGWAALTGAPDGPPVKTGLSLADYATGLVAALALMVGLFRAQRTGRGGDVDTNLYDVSLALLTYQATWYLSRGIVPERLPNSAHPSLVPFQFFQTADGWLAVACAKEKFFRALCWTLDLPQLAEDPRFRSFEARRAHRAALLDALVPRFRTRSTAAWIELLRDTVPVAAVRSPTAALDPEEVADRGMLAAYEHPTLGAVATLGAPFRIGGHAPRYAPGPALDGDREALLRELGYDHEAIEALAAEGAFGGQEVAQNGALAAGAPRG